MSRRFDKVIRHMKVRFACALMAAFVSALLLFPAVAAAYDITLTLDGGDCTQIGTWDPVTSTCTLTTDVDQGIRLVGIFGGGMTLDGAGHTVRGNGTGAGVSVMRNHHDDTIRNLTISGFETGIYLNQTRTSVITGNTLSGNHVGINIYSSACPSASSCGTSVDNQIFNNNFLDNDVQVYDVYVSFWPQDPDYLVPQFLLLNAYSLAAPIGGNYWSGWTGPDENNDGVVDSPFLINQTQQDALPWTTPNGWTCERPVLTLSAGKAFWASFADFRGRLLSVDISVSNPGSIAAAAVEVTSTATNNGVVCQTAMPMAIGAIAGAAAADSTLRFQVPSGTAWFNVSVVISERDSCGNMRRAEYLNLPATI